MASVSDGCLYIPRIEGNTVIVAYSEYVEPYIALHGDIESIVWLGGEYEGVPIVVDPNNANNGLLVKINNLEQKIQDLQKIFASTWVVAAGDGGAALKAAATSWAITPYNLTSQPEISHPKITH